MVWYLVYFAIILTSCILYGHANVSLTDQMLPPALNLIDQLLDSLKDETPLPINGSVHLAVCNCFYVSLYIHKQTQYYCSLGVNTCSFLQALKQNQTGS